MEETRKSRRGKPTEDTTPRSPRHPASTSRVPVKSAVAPKTKTKTSGPATREEWVRVAAYYRAERRGFAPGHDLEDWFAAEAGWAAIPATG